MRKKALKYDITKLIANDPVEWNHFYKNVKNIFYMKKENLFDEDVFASTIEVLIQKLPTMDPKSNIINFMFGVYRNQANTKYFHEQKCQKESVYDEGEVREITGDDIAQEESTSDLWVENEYKQQKLKLLKNKLDEANNKTSGVLHNVDWYDFLLRYCDGDDTLNDLCKEYNISIEVSRLLKIKLEKLLQPKIKLKKGVKSNLSERTQYRYQYDAKKDRRKRKA